MNRRDLLVASSSSVLFGVGGCLDDSEAATGEEGGGGGTDIRGDNGAGDEPPADWRVKQFAVSSTAGWWIAGANRTGYVELFDSKEAAFDVLDFARVRDERREEVEAFVENTPYEGVAGTNPSGILYVESVGPHTGYDEIEVEILVHGRERITGRARASETSVVGEYTIAFPSALVRVEGGTGGVTTATVRVIDGWKNEVELETNAT